MATTSTRKMNELNQNEKIVWSCWEIKTFREVVREAAAKGTHIPLAIKFLCVKQGWDTSTAQEWFNAEVLVWVLQLLSRKQFFKASHVLNKMQIPPHQHMMTVALESLEPSLRDYIVEQLIKNATEFQKESPESWSDFVNHWHLLKALEDSFQVDGTMKQNRAFGTGKNMIILRSSEIKLLTIEKTQQLEEEWKSQVAAYLFIESICFDITVFINPIFFWKILLQQNKAMVLRRWISISYLKERNYSEGSLLSSLNLVSADFANLKSVDELKQLDDLFFKWILNSDFLNELKSTLCFEFTKLCIYDTLLASGHVVENEKEDLKCILRRLARTQNLGNTKKLFSKTTSTLTKADFNDMLVKYCVDQNEYHWLTACTEYSLINKNLNIETFSTTKNCLDLWVLFKETAEVKGMKHYIRSIYEACRFISEDSVDKYLSENPILILAMILFDGDISLFEIFNKSNKICLLDYKINLEKNLSDILPHLFSVYQRQKNNTLVVENDVNVYQLLSGYKGLDISKVFEFQLLGHNTRKKYKLGWEKNESSNENSPENVQGLMEDMPHFLNKKLVRKYGYQNKLNYVYYLKQNRPCMAAQALLVQQYQNFGKLSFKMTQEACAYAHTLALQNWDDMIVTSSCISFIAMIGGDSMKCRSHVMCAQIAAKYIESVEKFSGDDAKKHIKELMEKVVSNKPDIHKEMLELCEKSIQETTKNKGLSEIFYEWQTIVRFASFHNISPPTTQLLKFVSNNDWVYFLMFGDIFKYDKQTMLLLSMEFSSRPLVEHIRHALQSQIYDDSTSEMTKSKEEMRKISRDSVECVKSLDTFDFKLMQDVWEVMASCHGPEDPPGLLIRASSALNCPILALIATCYEPDAVEICWAQWLLTSMRIADGKGPKVLQSWELSTDLVLTDNQVHILMEACLENGYYKTLYESLQVFYKESSLCVLMKFILQTVTQYDFGAGSVELLKYFNDKIIHQASSMGQADGYGMPRLQKPKFVQAISVALITVAFSEGLTSPAQQRKFLDCLCEVKFSEDFIVPHPDYKKIAELLNISMECSITLNLYNMCQEDAIQHQNRYIELLKSSKMFSQAMNFARIVDLPTDHILIAECTEQYNKLFNSADDTSRSSNGPSMLQFWVQSCQTFKNSNSNPMVIIEFLKGQCDGLVDKAHKFYLLRLISFWFHKLNEEYLIEMSELRDKIEFEMWMTYFSCDSDTKLYLLSEDALYEFLLNDSYQVGSNEGYSKLFSKTSSEIEQESNISNMTIKSHKLSVEDAEKYNRAIVQLLEVGQVNEAWRLSKMFASPVGYGPRPLQCLEVVDLCIHMAEGILAPCDLPPIYRNIVNASQGRRPFSESECSDNSFEELVLISDKAEDSTSVEGQLAGRDEADCLSALEALGSRSGFKIIKQVASMYRISLQIGWSYEKVLKYDGNPLDLINTVSGRSRMPLAKIIFRTYNISSEKYVEFFCSEIVASVVSPHLLKTSGFNQREHFRYTLWGYPLDSDFEMFLNLRPDENSALGRMIISHLGAFRSFYKTDVSTVTSQPKEHVEVDVDMIIDEEYQNIEEEEVESVISQQSSSTINDLPSSFDKSKKFDSQSIVSASTLYSRKSYSMYKDRRPQLDIISCTNIRVKSSIKLNMKSLLKNAKISSKQINVITIELLILAHECFSSICDTEGIATVLRSAQSLSSILLAARSWRLLVRLVTGLARYTEMAYVFQMLKDNDQFEFLLGQFDYILGHQEEKITNFKQGLLDFLKTHCPGDTEVYCLVALHFSMYSEAADVKKKQAKDLIVTLKEIALDCMKVNKKKSQLPEWIILANNDSNRLLLETAINNCMDSAELYSKGGCLGAAREMAGLAQLLALQTSLLNKPPTRFILNLTHNKMYSLVDSYLNFMEGLVFALASDGGGGGLIKKWRELVYCRSLRQGESQFVKDIAANRPDIAYYIIERYDCEKNTTVASEINISLLKSFFR